MPIGIRGPAARRILVRSVVAATAVLLAVPTGVGLSVPRASAQTPSVTDQFGSADGKTEVRDSAVNPTDGSTYVVGDVWGALHCPEANSSCDYAGEQDAFIRKYDAAGVPQWTQQFGTEFEDEAYGVAVDPSTGNVVVTGHTSGTFADAVGTGHTFVRGYDPNGNVRWTDQFAPATGWRVAISNNGADVYVAADDNGNPWVMLLDEEGVVSWSEQPLVASSTTYTNGLAVDSSGNAVLVGSTYGTISGQTSAGVEDGYVAKLAPAAAPGHTHLTWVRQFGSTTNDTTGAVGVDGAGNAYVGGDTYGSLPGCDPACQNVGSYDAYLMKFDPSGKLLWTRQFGSPYDDEVYGMSVDASGNAFLAGGWDGDWVAYVRKYDTSGIPLWVRTIPEDYSAFEPSSWAVDAVRYGSTILVAGDINNGAFDGFSLQGSENQDGFFAILDDVTGQPEPSVTFQPESTHAYADRTASFTAAAVGGSSISSTVTWETSANGSPWVPASGSVTSAADGGGGVTSTLEFTAAAAQDGAQFRATFTNGTGSASSWTATLTIDPARAPDAPTNLTATAKSGGVDLAWTAPSSDGGSTLSGYDLYRGTSPGGETTLVTGALLPASSTSYSDTGLTNGRTYYYVVKAVNAVDPSTPSNEAAATPGMVSWTSLSRKIPSSPSSYERFGDSMAVDGSTLVVGDASVGAAGAAYVFSVSGTTVTQLAKLTAPGLSTTADFGHSVAISGSTIVVGAPGVGEAFVFTASHGSWTTSTSVALTAPDGTSDDYFGLSVAVSRSTVLVGAPAYNGHQGAVYAFTPKGSRWVSAGKVNPSSTLSAGDGYGSSMASVGTTLLVGAPHDVDASTTGKVYVFGSKGKGWTQVASLQASDASDGDWFGSAVAISGATAIVAADNRNEGAGGAYVFSSSRTGWSQVGSALVDPDDSGPIAFAFSVSLSGTTAVIGAPWADVGAALSAGKAYVFTGSASGWTPSAVLTASDPVESELLGRSVAVVGSTMLAGAPNASPSVFDQGAVYVFSPPA